MNEEVDLEIIKKAITAACQELVKKKYYDREWTSMILHEVLKTMPDGLLCCCSSCRDTDSDCKPCYSEWLYDMTWYKEDTTTHRLKSVVLVLESEWLKSDYELRYDFEKLLQAKCKTKVFICQCCRAIKIARDGIKAYGANDKNERYLIAVYNDSKKGFIFRKFDGTGEKTEDDKLEEAQ